MAGPGDSRSAISRPPAGSLQEPDMSVIFEVYARMILDSRDTVEVTTEEGVVGRAAPVEPARGT